MSSVNLEGLPTALMQIRYILRNEAIRYPNCGYEKLAEAANQASIYIEQKLAKNES